MSLKTEKSKNTAKLMLVSLLVGVFGGMVGAFFSHLISLVTKLRTEHGFLILLLPVVAATIVFIYKKLGVFGVGTNDVLKTAGSVSPLSPKLTIAIIITSAISHLFGASVGREGAALQIGGSLSSLISRLFRLNQNQSEILIRAGMAGVFSAVFGTPITAFFFALEIVKVGTIHLKSVIPCLISSLSGFFTAAFLSAHPERFALSDVPDISLHIILKVAILTILTALLSIGFCYALRYSSKFAKTVIKNPYIRIILGGVLIVLLAILVGNQDYNGAGVNIIEHIFENGTFRPEAFALKMLFTCICVAAGYKGGEIVPTLFIGATFGALISSLLGLSIPFGAALGMVILFCGVTNCPLASIFLGIELFSGVGMWYFIPTVAVCYLISGKISLYSAQQHKFKFL